MTETELRRWLVKTLTPLGFSVQRNESGSLNEGYPDLTVSKNERSMLLELKRGKWQESKLAVTIGGIRYRPRQIGKLLTLSITSKCRVIVIMPDGYLALMEAPLKSAPLHSSNVQGLGFISEDRTKVNLVNYLNGELL